MNIYNITKFDNDNYFLIKNNIYKCKNKNEDKKYYIHDNGGRPFKVLVKEDYVYIFKLLDDNEDENYDTKYILKLKIKKIFIGKSPKIIINKINIIDKIFTDKKAVIKHEDYGKLIYNGPTDDFFDGNSILVEIKKNKYEYIGSEIYSFNSRGEITNFYSPVGNSDIPYPYAIDIYNNIYLFSEKIIIKDYKNDLEPYSFYYELNEEQKNKQTENLKVKVNY